MIPKVSVIVPVYNAEKYLHRCIDSILAQTFTDFELLLIDDGSKDSSGTICDEYAKKDSRIRVFHKPNGGVSSARNVGLDNAKGEWIAFADSDDWVEYDMLECMLEKANLEKAYIVIADYFEDYADKKIKVCHNFESLKPRYIISKLMQGDIIGSTWNKFFSRHLFIDNSIRFIDGIDYCEDLIVIIQILLNNPKITRLYYPIYHYDNSATLSITRNYSKKVFYDQLKATSFIEHLIGKEYVDETLDFTLHLIGMSIGYEIITKEEFKEYFNYSIFSILKSIKRTPIGRRNKIKILICKILGLKMGEKISKRF